MSRSYRTLMAVALFCCSYQLALGDLKLSVSKRHALKNPKRLWPNATVPFILDSSYNTKQKLKITEAMELIARVSCVRFVPRKFELGYMIIQKGNGCSARLGYKPNPRRVILGPNCMWSSRILHELMHILGFYHEQNRPDRDQYIKVYPQNIMNRYKSNFNKSNPKHTTTLDLPYDYHSILHYNSNGFAKNQTLKTMVPLKVIEGKLGMGKTLTSLDIAKLNKLYTCSPPNEQVVPKNETNEVSINLN